MPNAVLPLHPDLEQLKRQAKELLRSAKGADPAALARFRALPAYQDLTDEQLQRIPLALRDAQSSSPASTAFPPGMP